MNFIKENAFLVGVVAVVLVGGIAAVTMKASADKATEKNLNVRSELVTKMSGLVRGQKVKDDVVTIAKQRVEMMRSLHEAVARQEIERNGARYEVLTFELPSRPELGKIPAFPVNEQLYRQEVLNLRFQPRYLEETGRLLASLKATRPPTADEIKEQVEVLIAREAEGLGLPIIPPPTVPRPPGMGEGDTAEEDQPPPLTREELARRMTAFAQAQEGWIYADGQAMVDALPSSTTHYPGDELWLAQVALWVQQDIIAAINLTNEVAQKSYSGGQVKGVPSSAVKRLMEMKFRGYAVNQASRGSVSRQPAAAAPAPLNLTYIAPPSATGAAIPTSDPNAHLTGRTCNTLYDVVHYEFTVLIRTTELLNLCSNLMAQNYHTIIDARIEPVGQPAQGRMGPGGPLRGAAAAAAGDLYYYGTDGLVQVRILGELLMLTDWFRGTYDAQSKTWTRPHLMPVEFLRKTEMRDPAALREEDKTRLSQLPAVGGMPTRP